MLLFSFRGHLRPFCAPRRSHAQPATWSGAVDAAAPQDAAFAAETARADATRAMARVNADAQVAASCFAKMKRGACDALGEARDVSEKVAKAARLAESVSSAHDAARAASEATVVAVCAAGTALGDAAAHSFQATEQSVMDFAATRPEVTLAAEKSNAVATANVTALAADAGATVDAVVGAVARFQTKETQFSHEVDVRTTEVSAKALAELREGAASATTSVSYCSRARQRWGNSRHPSSP